MQISKLSLLAALLAIPIAVHASDPSVPAAVPAEGVAASSHWQEFVSQCATALTASSDNDHLNLLLADDVIVRHFGRSGRDGIARLRDQTTAKAAVAALAYVGTPVALATDLAAEFRDASVSDAIKRTMTPGSESQLKRANQTSANWITTTLSTRSTDLVGVIALVTPEVATDRPIAQSQHSALTFVLIKGEQLADGNFRLKTLVYGDPR